MHNYRYLQNPTITDLLVQVVQWLTIIRIPEVSAAASGARAESSVPRECRLKVRAESVIVVY